MASPTEPTDLSIDEYLREWPMPLLQHVTKDDDHRRQVGEEQQIDDKTAFIIKRG